ncbi:MAG: tRNA (N6-isopentenyl adenosine(37)-C2)-methylthiotransferase MiaB [Spirochaetales bacterium]|nr:tRNA (N6-isopentenyl adenosine(37)-C2)-methylthiotransferase MiaB [Spirochaetales bacterium]
MKYFILNLGCQMNQSDSERIQAVLQQMGMEKTENEEEAFVRGIVACSVRQKAIDKVYSKIYEWNEQKTSKNLLTFVSGCILPADHEKFLKKFDLIFSLQQLKDLPDMFRQYGVTTPFSASLEREEPEFSPLMGGFWQVKPQYSSPFEAFVPIQNGCDKFCTFCAVPYTRGREISRPSAEVLEEVQNLVKAGYKSVTLLGQNVNSYGQDRPGQEMTFAELLKEVGKIGQREKADFWTYFTSPHPRDMTREVLEVIAEYPVLAKQIHLPLQSGDDKVLIRMNRNYSLDRYRAIVTDIRAILPKATLFTDIIVGFTGETDEQFHNTRLALEEFQFQMAFIAQYSPRPGAASYRWEDDVPRDVKKSRFHELTEVLLASSLAYNQSLVGQTLRVIVDKPDRKPGYWSGRTEGKVVVRFPAQEKDLTGQFVNLRITQVVPLSLEGELIPEYAGQLSAL